MERTEIIFVLDRSGSMHGLEKNTIDGFNTMIESQKKETGLAYITTVLFDHDIQFLYKGISIDKINKMTNKDYYVGGTTALLDALGYSMKYMNQKQKVTHIDHVIFVVTTDGYENASTQYTYQKIAKKIKKHQEKHNWEFVFLGAGKDAIEEAMALGIKKENTTQWINDDKGVELSYEAIDNFVRNSRNHVSNANWDKELKADMKRRG